MLKGQISIEFLIIIVIFLSILAFSIISLSHVTDKGNEELNYQRMRITSQDIANTINTVCILGQGNSRVLDVYLTNYSLEMPDHKTLRLNYMNKSIARKVSCEFTEGTYSHSIIISCCEDGKIIIE